MESGRSKNDRAESSDARRVERLTFAHFGQNALTYLWVTRVDDTMSGRTTVRVQAAGVGTARRLNLPKSWTDSLGLQPGQRVDLLFDDVLVVVARPSRQAERVSAALEEP